MNDVRHPVRRRALWSALAALAVTLGTLAPAAAPAIAAPAPPAAGDEVTAADGATLPIAAINPPSRLAGMVAVYTPAFGPTTKTNAFGGEAVLVSDGSSGGYTVQRVCTVISPCADPTWKPGDSTIPADGVVLSVSPGGSPDVRVWMRDHIKPGDTVHIAPVVARSASTTIDAVDPTASSNPAGVDGNGRCFPGCRGAEQLVQYTPASSRSTTGTNDYGFEVTVVNGVVTAAGGNNREIPADGFVLSGHGARGTWLQANAVVGATITIEGSTLTATIDERTAIFGAERALADADARIADGIDSCLAFPADSAKDASAAAASILAEARTAAETGDRAHAVDLANAAKASAELAAQRTAESRPAEGRATWVRPEETTRAAIEATLDRIDAAGFNMVFLESIYQGYTIYPSEAAAAAGVASQRPSMVGFDPLQVWIDGAHARGIELHSWIHTFFVGSDQTGGIGPVLSAHPDWAALQRKDVGKGLGPSAAEPGYYFLDAANPGARGYVKSLLDELMTDYDIDGVHLDYIRYPVSQPWETAGYSYSDYSRQTFAAHYGVDPYTLTPADAAWKTWTDWRVENVTSFVGEIRALQQAEAPEVALSAAVFADPVDGIGKKFQNWADWVDRGYVDLLTGMSFGTSGTSVAHDTQVMRDRVGENQYLYTATYGPFRGSTPATVLEQIRAVSDAGSDGVGLFAWNQLSAGQAEALAEGPHRVPAVAPHADPVAAAAVGLRDLREQVTDAAPRCIADDSAAQVEHRLDKALTAIDRGQIDKAIREIQQAASAIGTPSEGGAEQFASRALRDLDMFGRWLDTALKR
ncbi:family 10 glycosylhydrolase [Microbacterium sp. 4R-513]|uniref:glycoside hydrolase family 10 protein n=1 Tax=Microbacterium sp. 4R-513 TaxID=2567934 RepID=UPI0013E1DC52|nr:family 10 glycosylhydrolase [Microbacterium sp. 4R-513]QIG40969.1 family 10 glycosylhydrolase [Microbacterium sp. 4R-513]